MRLELDLPDPPPRLLANGQQLIQVLTNLLVNATQAEAVRICDRHRGIGADGVLSVLPPRTSEAGVRMHIYNADGSSPEMCGNGLRCVVKYLAEVEGKTMAEVSDLTGLSQVWLARLYKVASLPPEVTHLIEEGLLAITSAYHLVALDGKEDQIQTARDAANWKYTESQVKARVADIQGQRAEPKPGEVAFAGNGKPTIIPLTCNFCLREMEKGDNYMWMCPECRAILIEFWRMYQAQVAPAPATVEPSRPQKMTLTEHGWRPVGG